MSTGAFGSMNPGVAALAEVLVDVTSWRTVGTNMEIARKMAANPTSGPYPRKRRSVVFGPLIS